MTAISTTRAVERCEQLASLGMPPPQSRPWKLKQWLRAYRAIMALDISEHADLLRDAYPAERLHEMAARANPTAALLRMVPRSER